MPAEVESQPSPQPALPAEPTWSLWVALAMFAFWLALYLTIPQASLFLSFVLRGVDMSQWENEIRAVLEQPWTSVAILLCTLLSWIITFGVLENWFRRFPKDAVRRALGVLAPRSGWMIPVAVVVGTLLGLLAIEAQNAWQTPDANDPFDAMSQTTIGFVSLVVLAIALAPAAEEMFFRGFLLPPMERTGRSLFGARGGLVFAVLFNAALFAGAHVLTYGPNALEIAGVMVLGIALASMRVWSGSVWPAIVAHLSYNACQLLVAYVLGGS